MTDGPIDLLKRAQSGDMDAFAELFEGVRPMVFSVALRLAGPDGAEDVVMETFLKAWQALPRFRAGSSLRTWLFRIARNCGIDAVRSRQRYDRRIVRASDAENEKVETVRDEQQRSAAEEAERNDLAEKVTRTMAGLSEEHRVTLLLRFADDLSYAEIAAATGVSIGTVMSRLFNAKRKLRSLLEADNERMAWH
jgi:RNA polymerase sigma-70 factor (ECF subfamily)